MRTLNDLYEEHDRQEQIIRRVRPELDELKAQIGVWMRDVASRRQSVEPVAERKRYAELQTEIWQCRNFQEIQREIGMTETHAHRLIQEIESYDQEIASLEAHTSHHPARVAEEIERFRRYRDNAARVLDSIGTPREAVT